MKTWMTWTLVLGTAGLYVACSPKQFSKDPGFNACQNSGQSCVVENGRDYFSVTETVAGGKVDVLVVTDNSASMSVEQTALANRFDGFISNLESKKVDYRIGVVTTDISSAENKPRSINQNGALQDGKLISFSGGKKFLTKDSGSPSQKEAAFKSAVQRPETKTCETFILSELSKCASSGISKEQCIERPSYISAYDNNCVSGDERGIFAARLVMENNPSQFIRKEADLAVIVLSDEDVRGGLYRSAYTNIGETHWLNPNFALHEKDKADSFISFMSSKYPNKNYDVHAIIVPYQDSACRAAQMNQTGGVVGSTYGYQYDYLASRTGGVRGSICSSDYTTVLQSIFDRVQGQILDKIALACANPPDVTVSLTGPGGSSPSVPWTVVGDEVRFASKLPVGTVIKMNYSCETL